MFCAFCGEQIVEGTSFCSRCGKQVGASGTGSELDAKSTNGAKKPSIIWTILPILVGCLIILTTVLFVFVFKASDDADSITNTWNEMKQITSEMDQVSKTKGKADKGFYEDFCEKLKGVSTKGEYSEMLKNDYIEYMSLFVKYYDVISGASAENSDQMKQDVVSLSAKLTDDINTINAKFGTSISLLELYQNNK